MLLLGGLYALVTAIYLGVGRRLRRGRRSRSWLRRAAGVALLGIAAWLLGTL